MTWRPCGRNLAYEVSTAGQVRRIGKDRVLVPAMNHKQNRPGYLKVNLGRGVQAYVHQLVAEAFLGPRPAGHTVDHFDFDRMNNTLVNLRYLPEPENSFRWKGRTADGRILWISPYLGDEDEPEDGRVPMSDVEREALELERFRVWS